ncbi:MAG: hypothetical protein AAGF23_26745, partial [Acidobacteriota bacterium]
LADALLAAGSVDCDGGRFEAGRAALERAEAIFTAGLSGPSWRTAAARVERARCRAAAGAPVLESREALAVLTEKRGAESWDVKRAGASPSA